MEEFDRSEVPLKFEKWKRANLICPYCGVDYREMEYNRVVLFKRHLTGHKDDDLLNQMIDGKSGR